MYVMTKTHFNISKSACYRRIDVLMATSGEGFKGAFAKLMHVSDIIVGTNPAVYAAHDKY
jgi:hypothetical protein